MAFTTLKASHSSTLFWQVLSRLTTLPTSCSFSSVFNHAFLGMAYIASVPFMPRDSDRVHGSRRSGGRSHWIGWTGEYGGMGVLPPVARSTRPLGEMGHWAVPTVSTFICHLVPLYHVSRVSKAGRRIRQLRRSGALVALPGRWVFGTAGSRQLG